MMRFLGAFLRALSTGGISLVTEKRDHDERPVDAHADSPLCGEEGCGSCGDDHGN